MLHPRRGYLRNRIHILIFLLLVSAASSACINYYYGIDQQGDLHNIDVQLNPFNKNFNKEHSFMLLSDYSIGLMKLGKPKQALQILEALNKNLPNQAKVVSNLGTAYELNGELDSALKYIRLGIKLNSKDHEGSEWVHVKVLETKLKLLTQLDYLKTHSLLNLSGKQKNDSIVCSQIDIQIRERFPFSLGSDPIMASLLIDLAYCYANRKSVEYAKALYQIAREYYGDKSKRLKTKINEMQNLISKYASIKIDGRFQHLQEGEHFKVGNIKYTQLLKDKDGQYYQMNWAKISLDVNFLLSLVDYMIIAPLQKDDLSKTSLKSTDSVKSEKKKVAQSRKTPEANGSYSWSVIIILFLVLFIIFRTIRKRI